MKSGAAVDAAIVGAGPSGCAAALRLLSLGRSVALIERLPFPRPQIGESLSPGVRDILEFLDAGELLEQSSVVSDLPALVAWESREPRLITAEERGPGVMVDRGEFDARLAGMVELRGGLRLQPALIKRTEGEPGAWRLTIALADREHSLAARLIIDARGRSGRSRRNRIALGPATLAMWAEIAGGHSPLETRIEASESAWLWGAPLPDGRFRVMAFLDQHRPARGVDREGRFRELLAGAPLFEHAASVEFVGPLKTRSATAYLDPGFWRGGWIGVGEKVLALDPLSSTGVEKSMRLALQGVIAANTVLDDGEWECAPIAREFYESRLLESAAVHTNWTRGYYAKAWPGREHAFWRERMSARPDHGGELTGIGGRFERLCNSLSRDGADKAPSAIQPGFHQWSPGRSVISRSAGIAVAPDVRFVATACAVEDRVRIRQAVSHPSLERPVVFLGGIEVAPLLQIAAQAGDLGQMLDWWGRFVPAETGGSILAWLLARGILRLEADGAR